MTLALYGKSRKRQAQLVLLALFAVLASTIGGLAVITSAFAHTSTISGTAVCNNDGTYTVTWKVDNDFNLVATIHSPSVNHGTLTGIANGTTIAAKSGSTNTFVNGTSVVPASFSSVTLSITSITWSDGFTQTSNLTKTVNRPSNCSQAQINISGTPTCTSPFVLSFHFNEPQGTSPDNPLSGTYKVDNGSTQNFGPVNEDSDANGHPDWTVNLSFSSGAQNITILSASSPAGLWSGNGGTTFSVTGTGCQPPKLKIVKDVRNADGSNGSSNHDFHFTISPTTGVSPTAFDLDDDSNATLPDNRAITLPSGTATYTITETQDSGWDVESIVCTGTGLGSYTPTLATGTLVISLDNADDITCTFKNKPEPPAPKVTLDKSDSGDGGYAPGESFNFFLDLDVTNGPTNADTHLVDNVPSVFTVNSVTVSDPHNNPDKLTCNNANPVNCTLASGAATGSNYRVTVNVTVKTNPDTCGDVENVANLTDGNRGPSDDDRTGTEEVEIKCATIYIKKVTVNDPTANPLSPRFTADIIDKGPDPDPFSDVPFDTNATAIRKVSANDGDSGGDDDDFKVVEDTPPTGWVVTGKKVLNGADANCNGTEPWVTTNPSSAEGDGTRGNPGSDYGDYLDGLDVGDNTTVCFRNELQQGHLIIKKVNDGGAAGDGFTADIASGTQNIPFSQTTPSATQDLAPGPYSVSEDANTSYVYQGFTTSTNGTCTGTPNTGATTNNVTITAGSTTTICFYNQKKGRLIIKKVNDGGAASDGFTADIAGGTQNIPFSQASPSSAQELPAGTYSVAEDQPNTGYIYQGFAIGNVDGICPAVGQANAGSTTNNVTIVKNATTTLCFYNQKKGTLIIHKVITNFQSSMSGDTFSGNYDQQPGSDDGTWGPLSHGGSVSKSVTPGFYNVTENDPSPKYVFLGAFLSPDCTNDQQEALVALEALVFGDFFVPAGGSEDVYVCNLAVGRLTVIKHDLVDTAHGGNAGTWNVNVTGPAPYVPSNPHTVPRVNGSNPTVYTAIVPIGTYTVSETNGNGTACAQQSVKTFQTGFGSPGNIKTSDTAAVNIGATTTVDIFNTDCGQVQGSGNLKVIKVIDLNGDKTKNGSDTFGQSWNITVTCPGQPVANQQTNASGEALFLGLANNVTCTVSEQVQGGYIVIGWRSTDTTGPANADGTGSSTTIHMDDGDNNTVTFYNQPRVSIKVHKFEGVNGGALQNGANWQFTLSGCGVSQTGTTDAFGDLVFSNLPPAIGCTYTVTETVKAGWTVSPSASQTASPTAAGQQATLTFTNTTTTVCLIGCIPTTTTPTTTPTTPTTVPTTPARPTEVSTVAGERTPGTTPVAESTPLAPKTGSGGGFGGSAGVNILIALLGLAAMTGGLALLALGRKTR